MNADAIYSAVLQAMQEADELSSDMPGDAYIQLMRRIASEATRRADACANVEFKRQVEELRKEQSLSEARAMWADLNSAETLEDLCALHVAWIGRDPEEPDGETLRATLLSHVEEFCEATDTDPAQVFRNDE